MVSYQLSPSGVLDPNSQLMGRYYVARLKYHQDHNLADDNKHNFDVMVAVIHKGNCMMDLKDLQYVITKCNRGGMRTPLVLGKAMTDHSTCTWGECLRQLDDLVAGGTTFTYPPFKPCPGITPVIFRDRPLSFVQFGLLAYEVGRCSDPEGRAILNSYLDTTDPAYIVGTTPEAYYAPPNYEPLQFFGQVPPSSSPLSITPATAPSTLPSSQVSSSGAMESSSETGNQLYTYCDAAKGAGIILAQTSQPPPSTLALVTPAAPTPSMESVVSGACSLSSEAPPSVSSPPMESLPMSSSPSPVTSSSGPTHTASTVGGDSIMDASLAHIPDLDTEVLGAEVEVQDLNFGIEIATLAKDVANNPQDQETVLLMIDKMRLALGVKDSIISNLHAVNDELCTKLQTAETLTKVYSAQLTPLTSAVNSLTDSVEQLQVNLCSALDEVLDDSHTRYTNVTGKLDLIQRFINSPSSSSSPAMPTPESQPLVQGNVLTSTVQSMVPPTVTLPPTSSLQHDSLLPPPPVHSFPPPSPVQGLPPPSPMLNMPPPSPMQNLPPVLSFPPPPSMQPVIASAVIPENPSVIHSSSSMQPPSHMQPPPPVQPVVLLSQAGPTVAYLSQHHVSYAMSPLQNMSPSPQQPTQFMTPPSTRVLPLKQTFSQVSPISSTLPLNYSRVPESPTSHHSHQGNSYQTPASNFHQAQSTPPPPRVTKRPRSISNSPLPANANYRFSQTNFPLPSFPQSFATPPPPVHRPQHATSLPPPRYRPILTPRTSYPRGSDVGGGNGY